MKRKRWLPFLLALLLILTGCGSAAEAEPSQFPSATVSEPEPVAESGPVVKSEPPALAETVGPWMEDWELFWKTLEENYPYGDVMRRTTGQTLADIEAKYRSMAKVQQTQQGLLNLLVNIVSREFESTGHLWVHDAQWYASFYNNVRASAADNAMCRYEAEIMGNEKSRALYGWEESEEMGAAGGISNGGGNPAATAEDGNTNLTFAYYPEQKAAYVEVRRMRPGEWGWDAERQALQEFFQNIEAEGYEHCIIDISNNSGGSTSYMDILAGPNITQTQFDWKEHYVLINGGDETAAYHVASGLREEWRPIEELPLEELPALDPEDLGWATHYLTMKIRPRCYYVQPTFSGRFWLLVSPRVYSASEAFAIFCKDTGFATLVGQATDGDGMGINPLVCVLPDSGIVYQFSTMNGLNLDGSSNEASGTAPDIEVPAGEDILQACLRAIEEAGPDAGYAAPS